MFAQFINHITMIDSCGLRVPGVWSKYASESSCGAIMESMAGPLAHIKQLWCVVLIRICDVDL